MTIRTPRSNFGRFTISREWLPVILLFGQSTFLATATGLVFITGRTLFLVEFGPEGLAYLNIAVAFVVSVVFYGIAEALKRWPLPRVAIAMVLGLMVTVSLIRIGLSSPDLAWLSFPLLAMGPLLLQTMLVTVGAQAGKILDLQQIKRRLALIFAGVSAGFGFSGFVVDPFLSWFGAPQNLLYLCVVALGIALVLQIVTLRLFRSELTQAEGNVPQSPARESKPLRQMLKKRYVVLIFTYQMLSALGTQLIEFLFLTEAQNRFPEADALAAFLGRYYIILNIIVILFMFVLAGRLMARFGMRYGLAANPLGALGIVLLTTLVAIASGVYAPLIIWLATTATMIDITLSNGTTFTAINSTYQALPAAERGPVQAAVEGIGVPVAYGVAGGILLIFQIVPGFELIYAFIVTSLVCVGWSASAFWVYADYVHTLVDTLRYRVLGEEDLDVVDSTSLRVIESFLASNDKARVVLGLSILEKVAHRDLRKHVRQLAAHHDDEIKVVALQYIERLQISSAFPEANANLHEDCAPPVIAAAIRAYCALEETNAVERIMGYVSSTDSDIRTAAIVGLLRYGGISAIIAAGEHLSRMENASERDERALAAQILGEVADYSFYSPLLRLLDDPDVTVRQRAIWASGEIRHPRLLAQLIETLREVNLRPAALTAICRFGGAVTPYLEAGLAGELDAHTTQMLIRASRNIDTLTLVALLKQHLLNPDTEIRYQILLALVARKFHAEENSLPEIEEALAFETNNALRLLLYHLKLADQRGFEPLQRTIGDEIQQTQERIFLLLSCVHDPRTMLQAAHLLATSGEKQVALALETLEVSLKGRHQQIAIGIATRNISQLGQFADDGPSAIEALTIIAVLRQIMETAQSWGHNWTLACALYCVAHVKMPEQLIDFVEAGLAASDYRVRETACWVLYRINPEAFAAHLAELLHDEHPQVARLATSLAHSTNSQA